MLLDFQNVIYLETIVIVNTSWFCFWSALELSDMNLLDVDL